jgi:cytochrome b
VRQSDGSNGSSQNSMNVANMTAEAINQRLAWGFQSWAAELLFAWPGIVARVVSHQRWWRQRRRIMYGSVHNPRL